MIKNLAISPWRVLLPVGLGTGLSLIGDAALYAVLPTHAEEAGVTVAGLASIGILLSANRFIRLALNGPIGLLYDHWPRRYLFIAALFIGAGSTAIYALTQGFWPLLVGRLLWGLAWAGIWVGGNTIILDISQLHNRGRWVGIYQISFYLGSSSGSILGGFLTDWLGYHQAMGIGAGLTFLGAIGALLFLPETRGLRKSGEAASVVSPKPTSLPKPARSAELVSAMSLMGVNRLVLAGILLPTFGLFLAEQIGHTLQIGVLTIGVATLTGVALGANGLISMLAAPMLGGWSDRLGSRWQAVAGGLIPGVAGFSLLAFGQPLTYLLALPLTAISGGSNQGLATALVGDLSTEQQRGRRLGVLFTIGDLTSAVGPPLAYALAPYLGLRLVYLLCLAIVAVMFLAALHWAVKQKKFSASILVD
jgi:MFS family permease